MEMMGGNIHIESEKGKGTKVQVHLSFELVSENGKVAVEKFNASPEGFFDAILMDIRMPEMDGHTACRTIRDLSRADACTIPIIAMTANAYPVDIQESRACGMNDHLAKPIEPEELYTVLAEQISGKYIPKKY